MITIDIPGYKKIDAKHLVLDYNGTLAIDGKLADSTKQLLKQMSEQLIIHILTADTFGTSEQETEGINCKLKILQPSMQDIQKETYLTNLGKDQIIAIGNGQNDRLMLRQAALSIVIIQQEGAYAKLISESDIVCYSIHDALTLLLNPLRIIATLRK